jgi:hypothetical protein
MRSLLVTMAVLTALGFGTAKTASALTVGLLPYETALGDHPQNTAVRYKMRINENDNTVGNYDKIIFTAVVSGPPAGSDAMGYPIGANFTANYPRNYADNPDACLDWPPNYFLGESRLFVGTADYTSALQATLGFRSLNPTVFPSINAGIDGNKNANGMRATSQMNVNYVDVAIEVSLGDIWTGSLTGWMSRWIPSLQVCQDALPSGQTYRVVHQSATISGVEYDFDYIFDAGRTEYLTPPNPRTEFLTNPGVFQAYIWGVEVLPVGSSTWVPLHRWREVENNVPEVTDAGAKLGFYDGVPVLELSHGHPPYVALNSEIVEACAGAVVGTSCWHLGALGASCDATCAGYGGFDAAEAATATSSAGGGVAKCQAVLTALGLSYHWTGFSGGKQGCQYKPATSAGSTRSDATGSALAAGFQRACPCAGG